MDKATELLSKFEQKTTAKAKTTTKHKWREIEQLKDKFELERELRICDGLLEYSLEG
jgi:hypothetical protein